MEKTEQEILREARFWGRVEPTGFCWLWTAGKTKDGYGIMSWAKTTWTAHKISHTLLVGEVPAGMQIDHLCNVRNCVNPDHLEIVTKRENARRMVERRGWVHGGVKYEKKPREQWKVPPKRENLLDWTHCKKGHKLSEVGIYTNNKADGKVAHFCKMCKNISRIKHDGRTSKWATTDFTKR